MEFILLSSMAKVLPDLLPARYAELTRAVAFSGETLCFQLAFRQQGCGREPLSFYAQLCGAQAWHAYLVRNVAVGLPAYEEGDADYLSLKPGLYPDFLDETDLSRPLDAHGSWQSLFFEVEGLTAGPHRLTLRLTDESGAALCEKTLDVRVPADALPPQRLLYTRWFHCDALCAHYHVPMFSERHWEILENFLRKAAQRGMNTVLTPIHTPPLDTDVGGERMTAQLVDITLEDGQYRFGFDRFDRWAALCRRCGITHFEMAHLYTQWGAKAAPKITVRVNGVEKRVFGWDTPATGESYRAFLAAYLPALTQHLEALGIAENCLFHISDEPSEENLENYLAAKAQVEPYLKGYRMIDALSSFAFYEKKAVRHPIPAVDHLQPFFDAGVPDLWTYYCCGQWKDVSNSFIAMPGERTRVLGVLLYRYGVTGFLQWGCNYYFSRNTRAYVNPYRSADGDLTWPAGDPFVLYPAPDGRALDSLRSLLTQKAIDDLRMLELLESRTSREHVLSLIAREADGLPTMERYPRDEAFLLRLREKAADELA